MRRIGEAVVLALVAAAGAAQAAESYDAKAAEAYIVACETRWTNAALTGETDGIAPFLADDFEGVDVRGGTYGKAKALADTREEPNFIATNRLDSVHVRFFGDTAVAVGVEAWTYKSGERGRIVWTDTWIRRDGAWKMVAAEDLKLVDAPAASPAARPAT